MKLEIEIPEPRFKVGDFLQYTKTEELCEESNLFVVAQVQHIIFNGSWGYWGEKAQVEVERAYYSLAVQEGSLTTKGTLLRPGLIQWCSLSSIHTYAKKVEYTEKVWEGDTVDNIRERI